MRARTRVNNGSPYTMISPPAARRTTLGATPATARSARRQVRRVLGEHGVNEKVTGVAELLTSEVVTNALLHARSASSLCVFVWPTVIRVEIEDPSSLLPTPRQAGLEAVSGRGLAILSAPGPVVGGGARSPGQARLVRDRPGGGCGAAGGTAGYSGPRSQGPVMAKVKPGR